MNNNVKLAKTLRFAGFSSFTWSEGKQVFLGHTCRTRDVPTNTQLAGIETTIGCISVYAAYLLISKA